VGTRSEKQSSQAQPADRSFEDGLLASFAETHDGFSVDRVIADPTLNQHFLDVCARKGLEGEPQELNRYLFRLRKSGKLKSAGIETTHRTNYNLKSLDHFIDASEIAWKKMVDEYEVSLDEILCDPLLASEFDREAASFAPGFQSLDYRWAALFIRKESNNARTRAKRLIREMNAKRLAKTMARSIEQIEWSEFEDSPGLYVVQKGSKNIFAGKSVNLKERLRDNFDPHGEVMESWMRIGHPLKIWFPKIQLHENDLIGYQSVIITQYSPQLNAPNQTAS
jgi:site-specific DNA-methyltransferase (adenine-specific)